MRIAIGCDHAAFDEKLLLMSELERLNGRIADMNCLSTGVEEVMGQIREIRNNMVPRSAMENLMRRIQMLEMETCKYCE